MSTLPMTTWGLDPLLHVPFQLMIFQVHALVPVPACEGKNDALRYAKHEPEKSTQLKTNMFAYYIVGSYSHHGHPVSMVEIIGVIQSVNRAIKYISYTGEK